METWMEAHLDASDHLDAGRVRPAENLAAGVPEVSRARMTHQVEPGDVGPAAERQNAEMTERQRPGAVHPAHQLEPAHCWALQVGEVRFLQDAQQPVPATLLISPQPLEPQ
jgi:hypothetical protein